MSEPSEVERIAEGLSEAQRRELIDCCDTNYTMQPLHIRQIPRCRPLNKLVEIGAVEFDFGPRGSFLQSYGYMPLPLGLAVRQHLKENSDG